MTPRMAPASSLELLLPALRRLDRLLEGATRAAESAFGPDSAADPYRGLYISQEEALRLLRRDPGIPVLAANPEAVERVASAPMDRLRSQFGLTEFDVDAVVVALAPEIDLRYERQTPSTQID